MNTSPVLIPFALLSLALRIGAGIKRCHRGFTIYLQPFSRSLVLSETAISVKSDITALHRNTALTFKNSESFKNFQAGKNRADWVLRPATFNRAGFWLGTQFRKIRRVGRKRYSPLSPKRAWDRVAHGPGGWRSGSAAPLHGDGRGFESLIAHQPSFGAQRRTKAAASK